MRVSDIDDSLSPLAEKPLQAFFGCGLHTLGLLHWILGQTGPADIWVSSYSTSEAFLNGVCVLNGRDMIRRSMLLLDQRAARKTVKLERLMTGAFDHVFLGQNHSKVILVRNEDMEVCAITSQNQTYGARAESTIITTDRGIFTTMLAQFLFIAGDNSVELDIKHGKGIIAESGASGTPTAHPVADWEPFGV